MHYDTLKQKTTHDIKELLDSMGKLMDGSKEPVNQLISVCMTLCDRIAGLEEQVGTSEKKELEENKIQNQHPDHTDKSSSLKVHLRDAVMVAEKQNSSNEFNAMSWLDLELENNPEFFDDFFDKAWNELSVEEQEDRMIAIRRVL